MDIISIRGCFCIDDDLVLRIEAVEKKNISYESIKFSHPLITQSEKSNEAKKYMMHELKSSNVEREKVLGTQYTSEDFRETLAQDGSIGYLSPDIFEKICVSQRNASNENLHPKYFCGTTLDVDQGKKIHFLL